MNSSRYFRSNYEAVMLACIGGTFPPWDTESKTTLWLGAEEDEAELSHTHSCSPSLLAIVSGLYFFFQFSFLCMDKSGNNHIWIRTVPKFCSLTWSREQGFTNLPVHKYLFMVIYFVFSSHFLSSSPFPRSLSGFTAASSRFSCSLLYLFFF